MDIFAARLQLLGGVIDATIARSMMPAMQFEIVSRKSGAEART
jgi:hypothetical protein